MKMESPKISRMWVDLQKASSRLRDSSVLSSCEAEIQELMRQVDLMVDARKQEWIKEKRTFQTRLEVREQELILQKATLSQKHTEIGQLRMSLDNMEQSQRETRLKYETDLANLREQVALMKRDYEKLQRRYMRHNREKQRDSADESDSKQLSVKLEEFRHRSADWEREKRHYQQQIESLQSQNQFLASKCDIVAQTSADLKSQLERRREMLSDSEQGLKSQVTQLTGMMDRAKDTIASQDTQLSRLKAALDDSCAAQRRALQEKEQIEFELRDTQQRLRKMEDDARELRLNTETQQKLASSLKDEQTKRSQVLIQLQMELQEKESLIQSLQKQQSSPESCSQIGQLQSALTQTKSEIKTYQKMEQQLRAEITRLQSDLNSVVTERDRLHNELLKKDLKQSSPDSGSEWNQLKNDNTKLQLELSSVKQHHESEMSKCRLREDELKREIATFNFEINKHKLKISELEQLVDVHKGAAEKLQVELDVRSAQLNASRVENRHLRKVCTPLTLAENKLEELQTAYQESLESLERHNNSLKEDITRLHRELSSHQQCDIQRTEFEKKIALLEQELNDKERKLRSLSRANEAMNNFVNGVDQIVQSPHPTPKSLNNSATSSSRSSQLPSFSTTIDGDADVLLADDRTRELEDILSQHIDELRAMTDATLSKYISTSAAAQCNNAY